MLEDTDRCRVRHVVKLIQDDDVGPDGLQNGADIRGLGRDAGAQLYQELIGGVPVQGCVEGGEAHLPQVTQADIRRVGYVLGLCVQGC